MRMLLFGGPNWGDLSVEAITGRILNYGFSTASLM